MQIILEKKWADKLCFHFIHPKLKEIIRARRKNCYEVRYSIYSSSAFPFFYIKMVDIVDSKPGPLSGSGTWYNAKTGEKIADWMA